MVSERRVDLKVIPGEAAARGARRTGAGNSAPSLFAPHADPPAAVAGPFEAGLRPVDL